MAQTALRAVREVRASRALVVVAASLAALNMARFTLRLGGESVGLGGGSRAWKVGFGIKD